MEAKMSAIKNIFLTGSIILVVCCGGRATGGDATEDTLEDAVKLDVINIPDGADVSKDISKDVIPTTKTIKQIQQGTDSTSCATEAMTTVLSGVELKNVIVTTPKYTASKSGTGLDGYFIHDTGCTGAFCGMQIVISTAEATDYKAGDVLSVSGDYMEYYCLTQLKVSAHQPTGTAPVPAAVEVDPAKMAVKGADSESYEGVLVVVKNVAVIDANPDAKDGKDYGEFLITGNLRVGNIFGLPYMNKDTDQRNVGDTFKSITGILTYSYSQYRLEPRYESDMVVDTIAPPMEKDAFEAVQDVNQEAIDTSPAVMDVITLQKLDSSVNCTNEGNNTVIPYVKLQGVTVTSPKSVVNSSLDGYYVADSFISQPWHGVFVAVSKSLNTNFVPGDIIDVTGAYKEYYCMTEINATEAEKTGTVSGITDTPLVINDPAEISVTGASAEQYEGVIITVKNLTVTESPATDTKCKIMLSSNICVADDFGINFTLNKDDQIKSITGAIKYNYSKYRLVPRIANDIVK
jgi:predicted extracellular nuclease